MRRLSCLFLTLLLLAGLARPARAGGVEPCEYASVFPGAALNVLVLPYRYEPPAAAAAYGGSAAPVQELQLASRQLASLVHLETLMGLLKYGSIGAKNLLSEPGQVCDVDRVLARIGKPGGSGALKPGQAAVLVWGRLFEQGGEFYLQSYLRFVRQGPHGPVDERLGFEIAPGLPRLEAGLPAQALAFAPRRIGRSELARVDRDFRQAMLLRQQPRADAPGRSLDFRPHEAFAYWITAARGDWMQLQPMGGGPAGWVQVRGEAAPDWSLQRWLPELAFVDAVAGFMRLRTTTQPVGAAERQRTLRAIEAGLARYEQALAAELAPLPWGLAAALRGWLAWERGEREAALGFFERSRELMPDYAGARQLAALARAASTAPLGKAGSERLTRELMAALALAPERPELLGNLEQLLTLFATRRGDWSPYGPEQLAERLEILRGAAAAATGSR
ncbi:hypothetical protein G8A07_21190 [Roseateles sp. DAIF2]|uniref:hypothetical protein n=1 Tax=Roseateles sp. DAIF2 TaxID=2714952 RepID=UPI0018A2513F|nr:hypothetical protein [Roseateles sp. DAIF2]QPF75182.1 hypothetical protein G8A07_21190 [Roseateles sp. DAIF2]